MRIVQLSTYPTKVPMHGGQIRVSQIRKKFESLNCSVRSISVSAPWFNDYNKDNDLIYSPHKYSYKIPLPFCEDLSLSLSCENSKVILNFIKRHLNNFRPNVIILEHPWLWPAINALLQQKYLIRKDLVLIYSSHNLEFSIKEQILKKHNVPSIKIKEACNKIYALEKDITNSVDYVLCVTNADGKALKEFTANKNFIILPNGVKKRVASVGPLASISGVNYLVYIGSPYPPNISGFWEMFGPSLARFAPNCKIVIIGGVGVGILNASFQKEDIFYEVNKEVIIDLGQVSEEVLASAINNCSGIILPLTYGGGSNLKTAEAIVACKPVVATSVACRGYDFVNKLSNFYICNKQEDFAATANDVISGKIKWKAISDEEMALRESVYWDNTLMPLENLVIKIRQQLNLRN